MLFISRFVYPEQYGVVDTDDGKETVIGVDDLLKCIEVGLDIKGVDRDGDRLQVLPYQSPDTLSKLQVKTKTMLGVEIRLWGDMITYISWKNINDKSIIKLSDFASKCADCIFGAAVSSSGSGPLIILDDNIHLAANALWGAHRFGVKFDVSGRTEVDSIYRAWLNFGTLYSIIDQPMRAECYKAVKDIEHNYRIGYLPGYVRVFVEDYFRADFRNLEHMKFEFNGSARDKLRERIIKLRNSFVFWVGYHEDYEEVRSKDNLAIFDYIVEIGVVYRPRLKRFRTYMQYVEPCDEYKQVYVNFCNRAYNWLYTVGKNYGWL